MNDMRKESLFLYLFRIFLSLGLLVLVGLVYWSSNLVNEKVIQLIHETQELKEEVLNLKTDFDKVLTTGLTQRNPNSPNKEFASESNSHIDSNATNLLNKDPFYEKTLPELLGDNFRPLGMRKSATYARPKNLHPFSNMADVSGWIGLCTASVATNEFGKYETFAPEMAFRMEQRTNEKTQTPEFWIFLRKDLFWQPLQPKLFSQDIQLSPHFLKKHPVTAHDFKFYFDVVMNPFVQEEAAVALRNYVGDIEEFEIIDDYTFVVRWKTHLVRESDGTEVRRIKYIAKTWTGALRPLASFVYKYFPDGTKIVEDDTDPDTYRKNSIWAQNFSQHWARNIIVSCGPWIFDGMTEKQISFRRNPDFFFPNRALTAGINIDFKENPENIWLDFKLGNLDSYIIQPNQLIEWEAFEKSSVYAKQKEAGQAIKRLDYLMRAFFYVGWNEAKPYFKSRKVRRAMTMAIDRQRIIRDLLNGMGVELSGPIFIRDANYNPNIEPYPFDIQAAKNLLEEEGWFDRQGKGVREKMIDGKAVPFRFALTYYVKNPTTATICAYISTALKEVGVDCILRGVDIADMSAAFEEKSFDAIYFAWTMGAPPQEPRQIWYSAGASERGSSNAIGFSNPEIDKIIDELEYEYDREKRIALFHRFHQIIHDEAPYTFLYIPQIAFLYREYLRNVFIPADRQDLVPGADVEEPQSTIFFLNPSSF